MTSGDDDDDEGSNDGDDDNEDNDDDDEGGQMSLLVDKGRELRNVSSSSLNSSSSLPVYESSPDTAVPGRCNLQQET